MNKIFPAAVPEIPVADLDGALGYFKNRLGFNVDWRNSDSGIAGVARDECRMFLTAPVFRQQHANFSPVVTWLNQNGKAEVDEQYAEWKANGANIVAAPESKPWNIHEFTASDLDGNIFRVFYDYSRDA